MWNKLLLLILIIFISNICYGKNEIHVKTEKINTDYGGIEAWLSEDHSNPIISMVMTFEKAGYAYDVTQGLSNLVAELLKEGAGKYNSETIADILESNGIILNYRSGLENFSVHIKTMSENFETSLSLLQNMLTEPHFNESAIERVKSQKFSIIKELEEEPNHVARREFFELVLNDHPYINPPQGSIESIKKITKNDLIKYVEQSLNRVNLSIVVSGDINSQNLSKLLDKYLINLPLTSGTVKEIPVLTDFKVPKLSNVHVFMDIPQSVVYFGKYGIDISDSDFYSAYLLNYILGGAGLNSLLMDEIRKKRGLTYGIYSWLENYPHANFFIGKATTDNSSVQEMILSINKIFDDILRDRISVEQLRDAKDYVVNSFMTNLDTNDAISIMLAYAQNNNLGINYIDCFSKNIEKVSLQDVNKIAKKLLDVKKMLFLTVGQTKSMLQ